MNNWEASPKLQFDRRRLERCYNLEYDDSEYKEECLRKVESYEKQPELNGVKRPKKMKKRAPYWNFWKVVFAGWLIRYPRQIFKMIGVSALFVLFMIVSVSGGFDEPSSTEYNSGNAREVISE